MAGKSPDHSSKSHRDTKSERGGKAAQLAREREEFIVDIRSAFVPFGHDISSQLVSEYIRYGHLKNTLRHLNLIQPADLNQQCDLILKHIEMAGPQVLLPRDQTQSKSPKPGPPKKDDTGELGEQILREAEMRLLNRVLNQLSPRAKSQAETVLKKLKQENKLQAAESNVPEHSAAPQSPDPSPALEDGVTICPKTGRPMKDGRYIERRAGGDRRHMRDRRANLEVIFKNRRFGGDRRKGEERRKIPWSPPPESPGKS